MIKRIEVVNSRGTVLSMSLANPVDCGIYVKSITGLGPPKATINMSEYCSLDGSRFNMARAETRNIVLSLGFLPNPTIEATRIRSYEYFPVKDRVTVKIETDSRVSVTTGYVESNEPDIFTKKEGCQVSILCPSSYFQLEDIQYTSFYGSMGLFEFPFSNPVGERSIIFGEFYSRSGATLVYDGEIDTGITIDIEAVGTTGNITIHNVDSNKTLIVDSSKVDTKTGSPIGYGDEILICTERGNKSCFLARGGVYTNIISCLDKTSDWIQIHRGNNRFIINCVGGQDTAHITVSNKVLFYGA